MPSLFSNIFSKIPPPPPPPPPPQPPSSSPSEDYEELFSKAYTSAVHQLKTIRSSIDALGFPPDIKSVESSQDSIWDYKRILTKMKENVNNSEHAVSLRILTEEKIKFHQEVIDIHEKHGLYRRKLLCCKENCIKIKQLWNLWLSKKGGVLDDDDEVIDEAAVCQALDDVDQMEILEENEIDHHEPVHQELEEILEEAKSGKDIENIELSLRQLNFVPREIADVRGLVSLNMSSNQIKIIPNSIALLEHLEDLNVSCNLLDSLPHSIGLMCNLKLLNVSQNNLVALPETITDCSALVVLDASSNCLNCLPSKMGFKLCLEKLIIHHNMIRSLPESVCHMESLSHLDVSFNKLRDLPDDLGYLSNMEILSINGNASEFTVLPCTFGELESLKDFNFSGKFVVPPMEIMEKGLEPIKEYMLQRYSKIKLFSEDAERRRTQLKRIMSWPPSSERRLTPL